MYSSDYQRLMGIIDISEDDTLYYHYCSSDTFLSICNGKKLRFSDMHSMNDFLEGEWGYKIFKQVCHALVSENKVSLDFMKEVDLILHDASIHHLKLICCLSTNEDVLSQWRAYSNDGNGYCLGFSAKELLKMPITILKVLYNKLEQYENIETILQTLYKIYQENKEHENFIKLCYQLSVSLSRFKNPAFKEEAEIRLIHIAQLDLSEEDNPKYIFDNGYSNKEPVNYKINYRMNGSIPTAFIDFDFFINEVNPIKKVFLGPKNIANPNGVFITMNTLGLKGSEIKKSKASYR
jgi:hypothetical protein